ncbi:hypothetical protein CCUS01_13198 [Colletotrichum cuscutae]|uniref:Uncharacterized protein n=1 Tax=Colletotrichum cuscutae TaxID=1209917 RepID=A0AAI9YCD1_9PEZI|nr:hypothetical protein CCUS01_13198 [Colletotrichum cuscutae]
MSLAFRDAESGWLKLRITQEHFPAGTTFQAAVVMADEALAAANRAEIISCFKETHQKTMDFEPHSMPCRSYYRILIHDPAIFDSRDRLQESKARPKGIPVKLGGRDLLRFKITPDKSTRDRFSHVINQIEPLLLARLKKKTGERIGPIAFRSMILGTAAENAHEHIVVLCPSQLLDTINEFFAKTKIIKELCEPSYQIPFISIIVEGREPRMMAQLLHSVMAMGPHPQSLDDVYMPGTQSLSGQFIVAKDTLSIAIIATCGGMIKVVDKTGKTMLYGMTAGHVFNDANSQITQDLDNEVEMIDAPHSTKPGLLSSEPTRILLGAGDAFTQAYILTLDEGEVRSGDSGAWVVGSSSHDVFGHIVARDMFGDAYVVPLDQTFNDIRTSMDATSVQLASPQDFAAVAAAVAGDESLPDHVRRVDPFTVLTSWHEIWHPRGSNGMAQLPNDPNRFTALSDSAYGSADSTSQVSVSAMPICISDNLPSDFKATDDATEECIFGSFEPGGIHLWEEGQAGDDEVPDMSWWVFWQG